MFSYKRCLPGSVFFLACRERGATSGDWRWRLLAARVVVHCPSSCHQHFSPRNAVPSHDPPTHQMSISDQAGTRVIRFLSRRQFSLYEDPWAILLMLHATRKKNKACSAQFRYQKTHHAIHKATLKLILLQLCRISTHYYCHSQITNTGLSRPPAALPEYIYLMINLNL